MRLVKLSNFTGLGFALENASLTALQGLEFIMCFPLFRLGGQGGDTKRVSISAFVCNMVC